jgi:hypothetical protein
VVVAVGDVLDGGGDEAGGGEDFEVQNSLFELIMR